MAEKAKKPGKPLPIAYNPWVRCLVPPAGHPNWEGKEWIMYNTGPESRSWCPLRAADKEIYATGFASQAAKAVQEREGGTWCGVVRPEGQIPDGQPDLWGDKAKVWAEAHTLDGPDCAGHRMLLEVQKARSLAEVIAEKHKLPKSVSAPINQVAAKKDIEKLNQAPVTDKEFWAQPAEDD